MCLRVINAGCVKQVRSWFVHGNWHTATHCNTLQHTATRIIQCNRHYWSKPIHLHFDWSYDIWRRDTKWLMMYGTGTRVALQHTATHCNMLQYTVSHCNTLQHTPTHCNTLQHTAAHDIWHRDARQAFWLILRILCVTVNNACCSVLQCVAVCCSVLQCVAVCCRETRDKHFDWSWQTMCHTSYKTIVLCPCVIHQKHTLALSHMLRGTSGYSPNEFSSPAFITSFWWRSLLILLLVFPTQHHYFFTQFGLYCSYTHNSPSQNYGTERDEPKTKHNWDEEGWFHSYWRSRECLEKGKPHQEGKC